MEGGDKWHARLGPLAYGCAQPCGGQSLPVPSVHRGGAGSGLSPSGAPGVPRLVPTVRRAIPSPGYAPAEVPVRQRVHAGAPASGEVPSTAACDRRLTSFWRGPLAGTPGNRVARDPHGAVVPGRLNRHRGCGRRMLSPCRRGSVPVTVEQQAGRASVDVGPACPRSDRGAAPARTHDDDRSALPSGRGGNPSRGGRLFCAGVVPRHLEGGDAPDVGAQPGSNGQRVPETSGRLRRGHTLRRSPRARNRRGQTNR